MRKARIIGGSDVETKMRVIAMGYGLEPLDRVTAGTGNGVIYIVNPAVNQAVDNGDEGGVGFPKRCVFEYSESMWRDLRAAWLNGDVVRLEELWSRGTPVDAMALA